MRYLWLLIAIIGLVACGGDDPATITAPDYSMLGACEPPEHAIRLKIYEESLCGTITVPEDRSADGGRQIDLNVMVLPATRPNPAPDPVFFLAGGPGQAATRIGPSLFSQLANLRAARDVVLVDQRGTGASNPLSCDMATDELEAMGTPLDELAAVQVERMRECLAGYDAAPEHYITPVAMDDLNQVREALGFDEINLYGISYGTRAALVYLRRHEDTVRSVILDSVAPLSMAIPQHVARDAQVAFEKMLEDCAENTACAAAFPDLEQQFDEMMTRLTEAPDNVRLQHPRTGESFETRVEPRTITRMVRSILYDRYLTSLLPVAITQATEGNYQPLVTMTYAMSGGGEQEEILNPGMMASVLCGEDMKRVSSAGGSRYFENVIYTALAPLCEFWPTGEIPEDYFEPVSSDVPVLLVSGTLDPITPPVYGEDAKASLTNAVHVIVPGVGHGASVHGCLPEILEEFLEQPDPSELDTACAWELKRPPFMATFTGNQYIEDTSE